MNYTDCLIKYVGLAESECPCYEETEYQNTSVINRFLDDENYSVPLSFTNTKVDCDSGQIWDVLNRSRTKGINNFISLVSRAIEKQYGATQFLSNFSIGQKKGNSTVSGTYYDIYINPRKYRSVQMRINSILFQFENTGSLDFKIINQLDGSEVLSETITITSSKQSWVPDEPLYLPFSDLYGRKIEYTIQHSGLTPKNSKIKCGCGIKEPWVDYMTIYGRTGASEAALEDSSKLKWSMGMSLNAEMLCNYDWLCVEYETQTGFGRQIGEAAFLSSVIELLSFLINRPGPYTPAPVEYIADKKNLAIQEFAGRVDWIVQNIPNGINHCTNCSKSRISKGEILI